MSYLSDLLGTEYREDMTVEDISAALENLKIGHTDDESVKLKNLLSKANSEAANYKKQLREKQSDAEVKAQETAELLSTLQAENATLKRSITISEHKSKLMGMGYDEKLAVSTAQAMADGDMETIMANQASFIKAQAKVIEADAMRKTPRPGPGALDKGVSRDDFRNMSLAEKQKFASENPDAYKSFYSTGGNE